MISFPITKREGI
uniref:Uncharacterized protein n=1 Tax=Anguilla anguilla TaxID=7936 RepID=A0A0E9V7H7_ANGAN